MIALTYLFSKKAVSASNESWMTSFLPLCFICVLSFTLSVGSAAASSEWPRYCKAGLKSMKEHNYVDAERAFQYAYECAERNNEPIEIRLECLSNLGRLYAERKDYLMAASTFKRAASLAEKESATAVSRGGNFRDSLTSEPAQREQTTKSSRVVSSGGASDRAGSETGRSEPAETVRELPSNERSSNSSTNKSISEASLFRPAAPTPPYSSSTLTQPVANTSPIVQPKVSSSYGLKPALDYASLAASSAELTEADFDVYISDVKRRVRRAWFPPKDETASAVVIVFTTYRDGHIDAPHVVKSSGSELVDSVAIKAIVLASPFGLLPLGSPESIAVELKLDPKADLLPAVEPSQIGKFRNF